jgi:hypothetical protein
MDNDNLKELWQRYDAELKRSNMINETMMRKMLEDRSSEKARSLSSWEYLSLTVSALVVITFLVVGYKIGVGSGLWACYIADLLFFSAAMYWNICKLRIIHRIDVNAGVVGTTELANKLKLMTIKEKKWSIALLPVLVCCLVPVVHNWLHGDSVLSHLKVYILPVGIGCVLATVISIWMYDRFLLRDIQTISDNLKEIDSLKRE